MAKVTMPQLGENVAEGTIGRWLRQPGDRVAKDDPLVEVITDKVNAEVPSPFAGTLVEILVAEGAAVPAGAEIAVMAEEGAEAAAGAETVAAVAVEAGAPADAARPGTAPQPPRPPAAQPAARPAACRAAAPLSPPFRRHPGLPSAGRTPG